MCRKRKEKPTPDQLRYVRVNTPQGTFVCASGDVPHECVILHITKATYYDFLKYKDNLHTQLPLFKEVV